MRDLYAEYMLEREGVPVHRIGDLGFATYVISGDECYIADIYVVPEARKEGIGARLADEIEVIAKDKGCKFLTGSVVPSANGSTESALAMIKVGFKLSASRDNFIVFSRSIK